MHRIAEILEVAVLVDRNRFEEVQQRRPFVPRRTVALLHHIVAIQSGQRDAGDIRDIQRSDKLLIIGNDLVENILVEINQVHLVDRQHHMLDT